MIRSRRSGAFMLNTIIAGGFRVQSAQDVLNYDRVHQKTFACGYPAGPSAAAGYGNCRALIATAKVREGSKEERNKSK